MRTVFVSVRPGRDGENLPAVCLSCTRCGHRLVWPRQMPSVEADLALAKLELSGVCPRSESNIYEPLPRAEGGAEGGADAGQA